MGPADQANDGYQAVFFMEGVKVARQMTASEFGAFLDGFVGLSDLAETDVRAVYVALSGDLLVQSLVFFRIYFDDEGRADSHWNIPVERFATEGAKGPDLGGGPIRLVCRSQCPEPRYAEELWDPDMTPGSNHFQSIRKAVQANKLKFRKIEPAPAVEEAIPVLAVPAPAPVEPDSSGERARLAQMIREQRLRIKTLQSVHRDALADIQREHRVEMQALRSEMSDLEQKYERQRLTNEQLKERLSERNEQYLAIQEQMAGNEETSGRDQQTSSAELVLLQEQLERKERELEMRGDRIALLEQENHDLRSREPAEDSLMRQLQEQSVFLVAYHPGVGHLTLPFDDIERYFGNPVSYAAEKCGLNEPAYREWLEHYENPVCRHAGDDGGECNEPVMRVSQPAEFRPGQDDRCEAHQSVAVTS